MEVATGHSLYSTRTTKMTRGSTPLELALRLHSPRDANDAPYAPCPFRPKPTPLAKAPTSNQHAPLQVDRSNAPSNASSQGSFIKSSPNAHIPSYPAPVRATPQLQMNAPTPIAAPIPGSFQPVATPEGGETFNLAQIANDPYERRKTTDEAEKDLKDLLEQSIGGEDVEVDMEKAIVEGFSKDWKLLAHQVQGRAWLCERESGKKCGGILGDVSCAFPFARF